MLKSFDYQCDTCDKVFEQLVESDQAAVPCTARACSGTAHRQLGGRPVGVSTAAKATSPSREPCRPELTGRKKDLEVALPSGTTVRAVAYEVRCATHNPGTPKAKA